MSTPFRTCARSHAVRNGMKPCSKRSVVIWRPRAGTLPCVRNVTCTEYSLKHSLEQRPTLLLVDDEASNLQVLRHTLQHDYRLLFAKDGPTALELAQRKRPHLILLDVMMPGMSGHDVCRALKQDPATQAIPVIFVTALADVFDALTSVRPYKRDRKSTR